MELRELERKLFTLIRYAKSLGFNVDEVEVGPILDVVRLAGTDQVKLVEKGFRVYLEFWYEEGKTKTDKD